VLAVLAALALALVHSRALVMWLSGGRLLLPFEMSERVGLCSTAPQPPAAAVIPWAILQYDNRAVIAPGPAAALARNAAYAARHGYAHVFVGGDAAFELYAGLPPWWVKVELTQRLLAERDPTDLGRARYGGVLWLDMDAIVRSNEESLEDFWARAARPGTSFLLAPDEPGAPDEYGAPFCAGVWAVRNLPRGRALIDAWRSLFPPAEWTFTAEGTWSSRGVWAGPTYEQGALSWFLLVPRGCDFTVLPWRAFHGTDATAEGAFTLHFSGGRKEHMLEVLAGMGRAYNSTAERSKRLGGVM
jgi:hypothetical protein